MIDLHLHTTASDGRCTPDELVERAWNAGIRTMSVTDHDTMAGSARAAGAARARGMALVPGIEITSVHAGVPVHVLGYFLDDSNAPLQALTGRQRHLRLERAREIAARLAAAGAPIDVEALEASARVPGGRTLARPLIAQMIVEAGHAASVAEAFARYLDEDRPAYVAHRGASPAEVVALIASQGGASSLAHPGYLGAGTGTPKDALVPALAEAGLTAIEAFHSSHDAAAQAHYLALARRHGLAVTGGSDYHGEGMRRAECLGVAGLPQEHFDAFLARAGRQTS